MASAPAQEQQTHPPQLDVAELLRRIEVLEQRVRHLEEMRSPADVPAKRPPVVDQEALQALRERHRELLEKYTASHPEVLMLEEDIRALEAGRPRYEASLQDLPLWSPAR